MTQVTVDLTGIQGGDTIIWDPVGGQFVKGPPALAPKVCYLDGSPSTLGTGAADGQLGLVRIGTGSDEFEMQMRWRASSSRWESQAITIVTTNDAWAVDGINQQPADFKNQWYRPIHGVAWYDTGVKAVLATDYTGGSSLTVKQVTGGSFSPSGSLMVRGWIIAYTGLTDNGDGTWTFTGCTGGSGSVTLKANYVPVIPSEGNNVGDAGGWGIRTTPIERAGELWAGGLRLQERVASVYLSGSQDNQAMDTALYFYQYATSDLFANPVPWDPPSGGLGFGHVVTSQALPGATAAPTSSRIAERGMDIFKTDWIDWAASSPTKRWVVPILYHRMPLAAEDTGEEYGRTHQVRWIWAP